jgi:hypothetical protein
MDSKIKYRYDLLPQRGIEEVCKVLTNKLELYKANQWRQGIQWSEVISNLKRHLNEFELGNDYTSEGYLQIAEVAMNALILCEYYKVYPQGDNRIFSTITKPIVALDIDDVCLDFQGAFQEKFNVNLNPYWNGNYEMRNMLDKVKDDKEFWTTLPAKHIPSFEPDMYITSRSIPNEWTMENLQKQGFPCAPVYSIPWNESKIPLLKQHKVDILIDDKHLNYKEATEAGIFCYLMDAPHNQYYNVGHRRIYNLNLNIK